MIKIPESEINAIRREAEIIATGNFKKLLIFYQSYIL